MATCFVLRIRSALACLSSLAFAAALSGCGSSSVSKPADAATDTLAIADTANPNLGRDTAQPDTAVDMALSPDTVSSPGLDASDTGGTVDAGGVVDAPIATGGLDAPTADVPADGVGDGGDGGGDSGSLADGGGGDAGPTTACSSLVNPLYIMTGDTQVPVLKTLGKALRQNSANPITLVWFATGSCTIIDAVYNGTPLTQIPSYIPSDPTWDDTTGAVPTCALESGGRSVDIGIPIVFPAACSTATPPANLGAFKGPVQSMLFVVPKSASPMAISSQQAALVFGTGATANIAPWTDENFYFIRPPTKGVEVSLGALIGVAPALWHGKQISASNDVATDVATSVQPDKTIGILGSETYDSAANRANLKALAFQAVNQTNGYLPDSTTTAFDKRSLREGHYVAWAHVFYLTKVASTDAGVSVPVNANAKLFIDILTNTADPGIPSTLDPVALVAKKGIVPLCAMTVTRSTEGGPLSLSAPPDPCGCYFESKLSTATVPASCVTCITSASCTGGTTCRHGYCEADDGRTSLSDCSALASGVTYAQIINNTCTAGARFQADNIPNP
ncbi:MAG: hypothetical protein WCG85_06925 [Polyangia bacterium]